MVLLRIWIDADAAPKDVKELVFRAAKRLAIETIGERLSVRDFMDQARLAGIVTGGPPPYDGRAKQAFAAALDRALTRLHPRR